MKKFLLFTTSLLFVLGTSAQTIPNGGFETWTNYGGQASAADPLNWVGSNEANQITVYLIQYFAQEELDILSAGDSTTITVYDTVPPSTIKVTGRTGNYAVKLQNVPVTQTITYQDSSDTSDVAILSGYVLLYSVNSNKDTLQGMPVTSNPSKLSGYYQFNQGSKDPSLLDTAEIDVMLTKWNSSTMQSDSIGYGTFTTTTTTTDWASFSIDIINTSGIVADTVQIGLNSTETDSSHYNTYFIVDDLTFGGLATGITPYSSVGSVAIYPNPATDKISVSGLPTGSEYIQIFNTMGRKVADVKISDVTNEIRTSDLSAGIYILKAVGQNGTTLLSSRFEIRN